MTASELLTPRYEVIAWYPDCPWKIGTILNRGVKSNHYNDEWYLSYSDITVTISIKTIEKYPNIFRKLNWWEDRKEEEMPKRIRKNPCLDGVTIEVKEWDLGLDLCPVAYFLKEGVEYALPFFSPTSIYIPVD